MSSTFKNWTSDNYAFVGKAFDFAYADRLNKLSPVVGEVNAKSIDYELTGSGGYGEAPRYDGENLNEGSLKRGFKTVITPVEYTLSIPVGYKEAKVDKMGETKKVGAMLGDYVEVGCNSVLNPGTVIGRDASVYPTSCVRGVVPERCIYKAKGNIAVKK